MCNHALHHVIKKAVGCHPSAFLWGEEPPMNAQFKAAFFIPGFIAVSLAASEPVLAGTQCGEASWYEFTTRTANGERANPEAMTAAHRTLPFGTRVRVTNLRNGRTVVLRINDRGPFVKGRVIDVTRRAALKLGFKNAGWTRVKVEALSNKGSRAALALAC